MANSTQSNKETKQAGGGNQKASATASAAEAAHAAIDRAAETAQQAEDRVRSAGRDARERADGTLASVEALVRERPVAALGVAFVVGALAASWLRR